MAIAESSKIIIYPAVIILKRCTKNSNKKVLGINAPLTKLGAVVVTVARKLVPNCSEEIVTKVAQ
jgi:hypothetical protein